MAGLTRNGEEILMGVTVNVTTTSNGDNNFVGLEEREKLKAQDMVKECDIEGDRALNQIDLCILTLMLSPVTMDDVESWLQNTIHQEIM
ncbi:hypothetical protein F3Y22_tig00116983pilonHSYRG00095 [Hibiscus syriacus]|uniref:Uncharacterized protein n=1 Tax=Hibiscus syriacus TaxID=106335 RepID=A0A6A2XH31_HIBSY|nr:hypothetical protein F3Y22_tig00116983pilonHSYRG00095 [Hibiscus syriacus]